MTTLIEALLSIAIPAVLLIGFALWLAAREDCAKGHGADTVPVIRRRAGTPVVLGPDPDAHLGRSGTE